MSTKDDLLAAYQHLRNGDLRAALVELDLPTRAAAARERAEQTMRRAWMKYALRTVRQNDAPQQGRDHPAGERQHRQKGRHHHRAPAQAGVGGSVGQSYRDLRQRTRPSARGHPAGQQQQRKAGQEVADLRPAKRRQQLRHTRTAGLTSRAPPSSAGPAP